MVFRILSAGNELPGRPRRQRATQKFVSSRKGTKNNDFEGSEGGWGRRLEKTDFVARGRSRSSFRAERVGKIQFWV